ncbi:MAG: oligosaccharide flippase family protein [Rhodospirillales bacterium]
MTLAARLRPLLSDLLVIDGAKIFAVNIAGAGLAFVSHILFARWLSLESYGTYVFALSWLNVLCIAVQAGMNLSVIRLIAEYRANGNRTAMQRLITFSNFVILTLGSTTIIFGTAIVLWAQSSASDEMRMTLYLALALTVVMALIQQRTAVLHGLEKVVQSVVAFEIARPVILLAAVFIASRLLTIDAALLMSVNLAVSTGFLILFMFYARLCILAQAQAPDQPVPHWRHWLNVSLPYIAVTGLTILLTQMDILMIGHMLGTEAAGLYAPAAKVALLAIFPVVAIRQRFGPMAARMFAEKAVGALQNRMNTATLLSVIACLGVLAFILPGRGLILGLFGPEYLPGESAVLILATGYLIYSIMGATEMFFLVGPFERINALVVSATLALNLVLNFLLIPPFGIEGAAMATIAAIVFRSMVAAIMVHRRTGLLPWTRVPRKRESLS